MMRNICTLLILAAYSLVCGQQIVIPAGRVDLRLHLRDEQLLQVATSGELPIEGSTRLQLASKKTAAILAGVGQLRGHVSITNAQDAVRMVRLRTSYATWYMWPDTRLELEILTPRDAKQVPNFGLDPLLMPNADSGNMAVLNVHAFRAGHFTNMTVTPVANEYRIVRWIFVADYVQRPAKQSVELIEETVGADGYYSRKVLVSKRPPKLPRTRWSFPEFA